MQKPEGALGLEPALDEPVDELLRLVGPAGSGDAEPERRVRRDEVDRVLLAEGDERLARLGVGEGELAPRPVEDEHVVAKSGPSQRRDLRVELLLEEVGGPSFSMMQMRTGRGTGMPSQSTPAARCAMPSIVHVDFADAVGAVHHEQRAAREEDRAGLAEQRLGLRERVREEVGERRELVARRARRADELEELVAAARPVAPVAALDGRPYAHRLAADDLRRLLGAGVAVLVGVVAERRRERRAG